MKNVYLCVPVDMYHTHEESVIEQQVGLALKANVRNLHFHKGVQESEVFETIYGCESLVIQTEEGGHLGVSATWIVKVTLSLKKPIYIYKDNSIILPQKLTLIHAHAT